MKANQKNRLWLLMILPILALLTVATVLIVTAEGPIPTVEIKAQNLEFNNNIYIVYAVKVSGIEAPQSNQFGILYWTEAQTTYEKGTEDALEHSLTTETVAGDTCYIFTYKDLAAKQMADDIYARAYIEVDGKIYYSDVQKYSILQYAYNMLGITGEPTEKESLKTLLRDMLAYGASAQKHFNYNTDRLANADFSQITVDGGTLPDGSTKGLYIVGETVTLTANETDAEGVPFAYWKNSYDENLGTALTYTATVGEENETYTAVYGDKTTTSDVFFTFTLQEDDTYSIAAKDVSNMPTNVVIPATYNEKAVTNIGDYAFSNCEGLTSIIISSSITSIGEYAFSGCRGLTSITLPDSVKKIGKYGFFNCSGLKSATLPKNLTSLAPTVFEGCNNLIKTVDGISYVDTWVIDAETSISSAVLRDGTVGIASSAFSSCASLASITIPDGVTNIGSSAFYYCTSLTGITLPDSVTNIDPAAFQFCSKLASIVIPDGVTSIDDGVFYACSGLTSITIPNSVTTIGRTAFTGCTSLTSITIPDSVLSIGNEAFTSCTGLTTIMIPDGVTSIGYEMFYNCTSLTSITIPNSVTKIGDYVFYQCAQLRTVYYIGTAEEWAALSIGTFNSNLTSATVYYYSETAPTDAAGNYWHDVDGVPTAW